MVKKIICLSFLCIVTLQAMHDKEVVKKELNEMFLSDQCLRNQFLQESQNLLDHGNEFYQKMCMDELNKFHCEKLKEIVAVHGWPKLSDFGSEIAQYAWIIVQHADHDVEFQRTCLELMQELPNFEIERKWIAYLYDRIQINSGKLQRYGTQINNENWQPYTCDQENESVDLLRKSVGLEPLKEHINFCKKVLKKKSS